MRIEVLEKTGEHVVYGLVADAVLAEAKIDRDNRVAFTSFASIEVKDLEWFIAQVKLAQKQGPPGEETGHVLEVAASADFSKVVITADPPGLARLLAVISDLCAKQDQGLNDHDHLCLQEDGEGDLTPTERGEGWQVVEEIQINAWQRSAIRGGR